MNDLVFSAGDVGQIVLTVVAVGGAYWRLTIRVTKLEMSSKIHREYLDKMEHTLERIDRKLDTVFGKLSNKADKT